MPFLDKDRLLKEAAAVRRQAYCPYSNYAVGAALLTEDGALFTGCNVENASYGLTLCAERAALAAAIAAGYRSFAALAVVAGGPALPCPCGACRQVLHEFCPGDMPIYAAHPDTLSAADSVTLAELLPRAFCLQNRGTEGS